MNGYLSWFLSDCHGIDVSQAQRYFDGKGMLPLFSCAGKQVKGARLKKDTTGFEGLSDYIEGLRCISLSPFDTVHFTWFPG